MKLPHVLLLALIFATSVEAQDTPPVPPSPPAASQPAPTAPPPTPPEPAEVVQPAIPVTPSAAGPAPSEKPVSFTQEEVLQRETKLKKQMMLVGMGSGVVGLLLGMMIGRKTAPRPTGRRF